MSSMRYLLRPFALWWRYFPQLAALYLLGVLGRRAAIELAALVGYDNDLWTSLIMPFAGLARLGSYVAMFLVLRPAIPALAALPRRSARRVDVFTNVIAPFFAIYLAWQLFAEDWLAFEQRALDYRVNEAMLSPEVTELHPDSLPGGSLTVVLIFAALVIRYVLGNFKDQLPGWMIAIRVYVDALWVFLTVSFAASQGLTFFLNPTGWLAERRIVVWFNETRADVFSHFKLLESTWDVVTWALKAAFGGATIPLLWLAIAGIIYGVAQPKDWRGAAQRLVGPRADRVFDRTAAAQKSLRARWSKLPDVRRDEVRRWIRSQLGNYQYIADAARLILHAGAFALSLYVLAYLGLAWLDMAGSFYRPEIRTGYLLRGVAWLFGPQPLTFWKGVIDTLAEIIHLIMEPLRVCLIASVVGYCLEQMPTREPTAQAAP
jgi:hypothetical protein